MNFWSLLQIDKKKNKETRNLTFSPVRQIFSGFPQHECLSPKPMLNQWSLAQTMAPSWTQLFANHANQKPGGHLWLFHLPHLSYPIYYQGLLALFPKYILNLTTCPHLHFPCLSYHYFFSHKTKIASFLVLLIVGSYSQPLQSVLNQGSRMIMLKQKLVHIAALLTTAPWLPLTPRIYNSVKVAQHTEDPK